MNGVFMTKLPNPAHGVLTEMERLSADGSNTFKQTQREIRRVERERMKKLMDVPGI